MYAWIWRKFPGNVWSKLSMSVVLVAAVGSLLWYVVFPWATPLLPFDDVQVGDTSQIDPNSVDQDATVPSYAPSPEPDASAPDAIPYSTTSNQPDSGGLAGDD
jgi:cytoskeletal protein RodZ